MVLQDQAHGWMEAHGLLQHRSKIRRMVMAFWYEIGLLSLPLWSAASISACTFAIFSGLRIRKYIITRRVIAVVSEPANTLVDR